MERDLRQYARQTSIRLILGGILLLFFLGDGLIWIFYGKEAAILGLICLLAGISPVVLIWLALSLLEWIASRANQ